jgi:tetratricopeptide (TPR) repeat protein
MGAGLGVGVNIDYPYAINLESTVKPVEPKSIPYLPEFKTYRLYTTRLVKDKQIWHRLRIGFFPTKQAALKVYKRISAAYPLAWVTIVSQEERSDSANTAIVLKGKPLQNIRSEPEVAVVQSPATNRTEALYMPAQVPVIEPSAVTEPEAIPAPQVESGVTPVAVNTQTASHDLAAKAAVPLGAEQLAANESAPGSASLAPNNNKSTSDRPAQLLEMARKAFTAGDYQKTIQLTTAILELPDSAQSRDALELLGLARERNGQLAHARVEYEKYLALYPEGEDAERVSQRLAGLITATSKPTQLGSNNQRKTKPERSTRWQALGSLSQFYYRDERSIDEEENLVDLSQLVTTFDMTVRGRGKDIDQRIQITGDHAADFLNDESEGRFSRFFYEVVNKKYNNNLKLGRQTYSQGGVLGRFDGVLLGVSPTKKYKVNAALGYLLDVEGLIDFNYDTNRRFVTLNIDIGDEFKDWDINFYFMQQMVEDIVDRQAIGGELRYFKPNFNVFSTIDYDTSYNLLNIFLLNANWVFQQQGNMFLTIDIRRVPYLSTSNALQGQPFTTMNEMLAMFTEDEVRQLALDRTALSRTFTIGGSKQLNGFLDGYGQYQLSGDFTLNTTTSTPGSAGVPSLTGTGNNYFLGGQFIGNGIFRRGDAAILSMRFGYTNVTRDIAVSLDTRFPFTRNLRLNPRFQYLRRTGNQNGNLLRTTRFSAKMDYRIKNRLTLEGEIGIDDTNDEASGFTTTSKSLFYYLGYRWDF